MKKPTSLLLLVVFILAGMVIAIGLAGCRNPFFRPTPPVSTPNPKNDSDQAIQAVSDYVTALKDGDYGTAYGMLSSDSQKTHTAANFEQQGKQGMPLYDLQKMTATVTGDDILVEVQQLEDPATHGFQLARESGVWKIVYRGGIPGAPDPE